MRDFVFVDTETTGLDSTTDSLVEMSYAINDGPIKTLYFGMYEVPPFIDNLIGFSKRGIAGKISPMSEFNEYTDSCLDATMVAANPTFDAGFLQKRNLFPFHYRMVDLSAYAMGVLNLAEMPGQADVVNRLNEGGWGIPEPDHSSYNDVAALQASFYALRDIANWYESIGESYSKYIGG